MPTIHIHLTAACDVADVVEHLLTNHQGITIDIDQNDDDELAGDPTEPNQDAERLAARAATETVALNHHPVIDAVEEAKRLEREQAQREMTVRKAVKVRTRDTFAVGCTNCKAAPGMQCQTPQGNGYGYTFVHNVRRRAYNKSRRAAVAS